MIGRQVPRPVAHKTNGLAKSKGLDSVEALEEHGGISGG
jgi:hypothetical protein